MLCEVIVNSYGEGAVRLGQWLVTIVEYKVTWGNVFCRREAALGFPGKGNDTMKKLFNNPYVKGGLLIVICGAILILFNNWVDKATISIGFSTLNDVLTPVYIGIILAFLMCPIYNSAVGGVYRYLCRLDEKPAPTYNSFHTFRAEQLAGLPAATKNRKNLGMARIIASTFCLILVLGIVALLTYFVAPQLIETSKELLNTGPDKLDAITSWITKRLNRYPSIASKAEEITSIGYTEAMNWLKTQLTSEKAQDFAEIVSTGLFSVIGFVVDAFIGVLIMVYLLNYKEKLFAICRKISAAIFKERTAQNIKEFVDIIDTTFVDFIVGRIIDSAIIGVLTFVCMTVFGMSFAPMISVIVGVTNVIPFFGPFIGAIPSILILLIEQPGDAIWFAVLILLIQQLDGNVIGPKIVGTAIGIESFWVLIAVLVGGGLFGFVGMVLGVPVFAVIYKYANKVARKKLSVKNKDVKTTDYMSLDEFGIDISEVDMRRKAGKGGFFRKKRHHGNNPTDSLEETIDESQLIDTTDKDGNNADK